MAQTPIEYFEAHSRRYIDEIASLCEIPSISFPGFDPAEVAKSAEAVAALFKKYGLSDTHVARHEDTPPAVIARAGNDLARPTYVLYAHHDVQPAGDDKKWHTPPFKPQIRDGRLYARGAADDKAGIVAHLAAMDAYLKTTGTLPVNLVVFIEGEEESGSSHLDSFLRAHADQFKGAKGLVVLDSGNIESGVPCLTVSLRGILAMSVEVRALKNSLHSGLWGGPVPDPVMALCHALSALVTPEGEIAIGCFQDMVAPVDPKARAALDKLPINEEVFRKQSGMVDGARVMHPKGRHFMEANWYLPALTINAIQASSREKAANIICDSAWARLSVRTVPNIRPEEAAAALQRFIESRVPWGCETRVEVEAAGAAWRADTSHPIYDATREALSEGYGAETLLVGCGASIPMVEPFSRALGGAPALLIGIADPYSNYHSENESLNIDDFNKTVRGEIALFEKLAAL